MSGAKKKSLTPYMDEAEKRLRQFLPDLENMPEPTALDMMQLETLMKHHGHQLGDDDVPDDPEVDGWEEEP